MADVPLVANLIKLMGNATIVEICANRGCLSELENLKRIIEMVLQIFQDYAGAQQRDQTLNLAIRNYLMGLRKVVYDIDDYLNNLLALATGDKKFRLMRKVNNSKWFEKVRIFFSCKTISLDLKGFIRKLNDYVTYHPEFNATSRFDLNAMRMDRIRNSHDKVTSSYIYAESIIGRENDRNNIIDFLLNSDNADFSCLSIVGVGGVGKTALAQLVFNDERIQESFDERLWVCVADNDTGFDVKEILCQILNISTASNKFNSSSSIELLLNRFQQQFLGKKYFLVLDDVWTENSWDWHHLKDVLMLNRNSRSKVVVTTRSEITATTAGSEQVYKLQGLSQEESWRLFERFVFGEELEHEEFVEIGKKIVQKCYNNPLAIRVVGNLLRRQPITERWSFKEAGFADISIHDHVVLPTLKASYLKLPPAVQSCFNYCALFPKDFEIEKGMLLDLWMAQGYIDSSDSYQTIEDVAEEVFLQLLQRCFFQDVKKDEYGNVKYVTIHGLMHDIAQEEGRGEIRVVTSTRNNLEDNIRHVHFIGDDEFPGYSHSSKIRSYISRCHKVPLVDLHNWRNLRVLELSFLDVKTLPHSIGDLLQLRYLNLSSNDCLELVSASITKLHNLQTLDLHDCSMLRELPMYFTKLVKLRHLDLYGCDQLTCMPSDINELTSLRVLPFFVVGKSISTGVDDLADLKALTNIKGYLCIKIGENYRNLGGVNDRGEGYLKNMEHLLEVTIEFEPRGSCLYPEVVLEALKPHRNLKGLILYNYAAAIIPRWGNAWAISLPNLIKIDISYCVNLHQLPVLSKLPFLKSLRLHKLYNLEYMENTTSDTSSEIEEPENAIFFPSLESLHIRDLKRLKGWWKGEGLIDNDHSLSRRFRFRRLSKLELWWCPELKSFPPCPSLSELQFHENNEMLQIIVKEDAADGGSSKLRHLSIDNVSDLKSLLTDSHNVFSTADCNEIESFSEAEEVSGSSCVSPLQGQIDSLSIKRRLPRRRELEHLTGLESLTMLSDDRLSIPEDNDVDSGMLWKCFHQNLRSLEFQCHENMTSLPNGMQYLNSLRTLQLYDCYNLKAIPEWISCLSSLQSMSINYCPALRVLPEAMQNLTSLQRLEISDCPELSERCREPYGEHWHKIKHIPCTVLRVNGSLVSP